MAKGKKGVLRTDKKSENTGERTVTAQTETKENKPAAEKNCISKVQSNFQSLQSSSKPRSPLSDSLIKEGNDSDATNPDMSKLIFRTENKAPQNRKVTDYFPIRRSNRKTKTELKSEEHKHLDDLINNGTEEGMEVKHIEGKGRGVFAIKGFKKGEYVVEYHGDLLDLSQAKMREAEYAEDPQTGCYMYYFQYQSKTYCVDGTKETGRLGRLINHSKNGNCQTRLHPIDGAPHLILVASRDIEAEEELLYDYGDRSSNTDGDSDNEPLVKMAKVSSKAARKPRSAAPRKSASRKKRASPQKDDSSDDDEPLSQIAKKVRDQYPRRRAAMASKKPPPAVKSQRTAARKSVKYVETSSDRSSEDEPPAEGKRRRSSGGPREQKSSPAKRAASSRPDSSSEEDEVPLAALVKKKPVKRNTKRSPRGRASGQRRGSEKAGSPPSGVRPPVKRGCRWAGLCEQSSEDEQRPEPRAARTTHPS
ncbi:LOW QUALITY PROTEIN: uncharacterized protein ACNS7B_012975 [Menidia menidia]